MPTDADRAAFAEAKDICAERGWELHGWIKGDNDTWQRRTVVNSSGRACSRYIRPIEDTDTDIDATIAVMARGLRDEHLSCIKRTVHGTWKIWDLVNGFVDCSSVLDCPDSELAALVAACKEVGK